MTRDDLIETLMLQGYDYMAALIMAETCETEELPFLSRILHTEERRVIL
jgi:hypothetical protein